MYLKYDNIYLFLLIYFQTLKDGVLSQLFNRDEGSGVGVFFGDDEIEVYETVNNNLSSFTHSPILPGQFSHSQGELCINLNKVKNNISFFNPLLAEFYQWINAKNETTDKLSAKFLEVIAEEHRLLMNDLKQLNNELKTTSFDKKTDNLLYLRELRRNITMEKGKILKRLDQFEKDLENVNRKIGCSGSSLNIAEGKFCQNDKFVFLIGSRIGTQEDLKPKFFKFSRLKLYGQLWNLKFADGNVAFFEIPDLNDENTEDLIKNIKEIQEVASSVNISVILDIPHAYFEKLEIYSLLLKEMQYMSGVTGINVAIKDKSHLDTFTLSKITEMRNKLKLVLFSATFICNNDYISRRDCFLANCTTWESTGNRYGYRDACYKCLNYHVNNKSCKIHLPSDISDFDIAANFDFLVLRNIDADQGITELVRKFKLPIVYQGLMKPSKTVFPQLMSVIVDHEAQGKSNTLEVIKAIKKYKDESNEYNDDEYDEFGIKTTTKIISS
ncbi:uncharacterized protein LOC136041056 [Artemia franciscana]|uniref:Uncharacterized protein n=1 Tax=Artemia franciscana TaxID=6661 RepID=A0AA88L1T7_ARTSF|nr:hypothetical protein QYM36_009332 [Artemia franciscana]